MAELQPQILDGGIDIPSLLASERAMASVCESVIGACYLHHGFEETGPAVVAAFSEQVDLASETVLDFKSALQERLARDGGRVRYEVTEEEGPPHERLLRGRRRASTARSSARGRGARRRRLSRRPQPRLWTAWASELEPQPDVIPSGPRSDACHP